MFGNEKLITFLVVVVIMKVSADEGDAGLECCVCIQSWGVYMEVCHLPTDIDRNERVSNSKWQKQILSNNRFS